MKILSSSLLNSFALFNSKGIIALQEKNLIITAVLLMLIVVIPALTLAVVFAWKYRASNSKSNYTPNWDHDLKIEFLWLAVPIIIITTLAVITWKNSHALDPYKPLVSTNAPITIQVVALRWKWLFIYPQQKIATVNFVEFPADTPVNFELTADAPMSSFWIPQLGGQIYAMNGMSTRLHLMAEAPGEFPGSAAEINGRGFAGMKFVAKATTQEDFLKWIATTKQSTQVLNLDELNKLSNPSENTPPSLYGSAEENLFSKVMMKFMAPSQTDTENKMSEMEM